MPTTFSDLRTLPNLTKFPSLSITGSALSKTLTNAFGPKSFLPASDAFTISSKNSQPLWFKSLSVIFISTPFTFAISSSPAALDILFKCVLAFSLLNLSIYSSRVTVLNKPLGFIASPITLTPANDLLTLFLNADAFSGDILATASSIFTA